MPAGIGERIFRRHGHWSPLLVDGFLRGAWKLRRERRAATVEIELDPALAEPDRAPIFDEGARLLEFLAADAHARGRVPSASVSGSPGIRTQNHGINLPH